MKKQLFLVFICMILISVTGSSQSFTTTSDLFMKPEGAHAGKLVIHQDPAIDTMINRYIMANYNLYVEKGYYGMNGFRIQIYSSSNRNAREEANRVRAEFISKFPGINSIIVYSEPGYFKTRVGDFRTRTEAAKLFQVISRSFPDAYLVSDFIPFPDLNTK